MLKTGLRPGAFPSRVALGWRRTPGSPRPVRNQYNQVECKMAAVVISRARTVRVNCKLIDSIRIRFSYDDALRVAFRTEFRGAFWDPGNKVWEIPYGDYDRVVAFFCGLGYVVIDGREVVADPRQ